MLTKNLRPNVQLPPAEEWDPLNYGQLLAAAVAIEPLGQVLKLTFFKRRELWHWIITRPRTVIDEVVFIITGRRNPWKRLLAVICLQPADSINVMVNGMAVLIL
ncbi:hypothetical protein PM082_008839 [Marasmius tenuissimus]|nr:hypothetical protein PM082_008839 [Marasmius tenuissimus]